MKRITFKIGNTIQVFRLGKTTNLKISDGTTQIVQTYTFSSLRFSYIKDSIENGTKRTMDKFFSLDAENCFDCPFSSNSGDAKCYTHKYIQYSGFIGTLKSIVNEFGSLDNIPTYNKSMDGQIAKFAINRYVRFGSYGEPTMHPVELVDAIANVAKNWTGYTHQYVSKPEYSKWFMASTHNQLQANTASNKFGFRSFIAIKDNKGINAVVCPASNESKADANCSDCGLCSGVIGKGSKDVVILEH